MSNVLLLFVDGIGIGSDDPNVNPFAQAKSPYMPFYRSGLEAPLPHGGVLLPTRVDMGVNGLPQSATGQTALLCGVKSSRVTGRHISGFPTPTLRRIIDERSIFLELKNRGRRATFANAFNQEYFDRFGERISTTTRSLLAGGWPPRMLQDLWRKQAVSHDLTNAFLAEMGYDVPLFSVAESGHILSALAQKFDFCLFEYILSDRMGHDMHLDGALTVIKSLHTLLDTLLPRMDLSRTTVIFTSDHGNMEDLSVKTHTRHTVPTVVWGVGREHIARKVREIDQITPAILEVIS